MRRFHRYLSRTFIGLIGIMALLIGAALQPIQPVYAADTAPTVAHTSVPNGATDVPPTQPIVFTFSEPVTPNWLGGALDLICGGSSLAYGIDPDPAGTFTATIWTLNATMPANTSCTITLNASKVADADSDDPPDTMAANYTLTFTTGSQTDVAPMIANTSPVNGTTNVLPTQPVVLTFSEPVTPNWLGGALDLVCGGSSLAYGIDPDPSGTFTATIWTLNATMPENSSCTITLNASKIADADTNDPPDTMLANYTFSFTTGNFPDVSISPASFNVNEGSNADFTITRTGSTTSALVVTVNVTLGTDTVDADYDLSGGSISGQSGSVTVTIPATQASVNVNLAALDDVDAEADNTLTVALVDGAAYDLGTTTSATATIPQNDFVVTNTNDSGDGSLRQVITNANTFNTDDTITFAASANGTITLASALPDLTNNGTLTITGNGAANTIISGNNAVRVFSVDTNANVTLNSLTVTGGNAGANFGGGIRNEGTLTVNNSTISGNAATFGGGGIYSNLNKTLTVTNSIIRDNSATAGGGIHNASESTLTVTNSIISGNAVTEEGGGIYNAFGTLRVNNSTISGNAATSGGGIYSGGSSGMVNLRNSIVANSTSGGDCVSDLSGELNAQHSLIEDGLTCVNGTNTANLTGDPALNGDLTLTSTSIAINAGNNSLIPSGVTTDLAGNTRIQQTTVDMGAYESPFTLFAPEVTIGGTANIAEGSNANFTLTRTGSTDFDLPVTVNVTPGTGTIDADYDLSGGSISGQTGSVTVTIPTGQSSVNVNFAALDDVDAEADNTLTVALVDGAAYDLGTTSSATATIPQNDFVVTNTNDSGDGSLRQAITNANTFNTDDTITFAASANGTITLASALPDLMNNGTLTITGNGAANTIVSGNNAVRVFQIASNANVTLNSLTMTGGNAGSNFGGGIRNEGTLTVNNSTISNNSTSGNGGGIFSNSGKTLTITNSLISGNSAESGGGIFSFINATLTVSNSIISGNSVSGGGRFGSGRGGGILAIGALTVTNSTISGNAATINGGGIYSVDSTLTVTNSTISGNAATSGGGIYSDGSNSSLNLRNSIIANGVSGGDCVRGGGTINAQNSLIEDGLTCVNGTNTANLTGDPALNGDLTLTSTSIAINAGDNTFITGYSTDLAGNTRIQQTTVDMGAYESAFTAPIPQISISATDNSGAEAGSDTATFTITRSGASIVPALTLSYTIGGTATNGADYSPTLTGSVEIPAGQPSVTVVVTPTDDTIVEGSETVTLTLSTNTAYTIGTDSDSAMITDNDTAAITFSTDTGAASEDITPYTTTIALTITANGTPNVGSIAAEVSVPVINTDGTAASTGTVDYTPPATTTVTFAQDAVSGATQTLDYAIVDDAFAESGETFVLSFNTVTGLATASGTQTVTITDNDPVGITVNPTSGLITTEAGGTAAFTMVLASEPTADVVIGVSSSDTSEGTLTITDVMFTPLNWNTAQTVTVTGINDVVDDGNIAYTIVTAAAVSTDPNYSGLNASDVSVTNIDDDNAGITVTPTNGLVTNEAGGQATFTVVLNTQPTADVTIGVSSSNTEEGTVLPLSLTFTAASWNVAQTVTVTGINDVVDDGNIAYTIVTAAAVSTDPNFNGLNASDVSVTNTDDDVSGFTIDPTGGLVTTEGGGQATFTVALNSQPTADVTIGLSSSDASEGAVLPLNLTFTAANWNMPQTVTVTGVDDGVDDGDIAYQIITAAAVSTDAAYTGLDAADVGASNTDDDTAGINFTPALFYMTEVSAVQTYYITVETEPGAPFTLALSFDTTQLTVDGSSTSPVLYTFNSGGVIAIPVDVIENDAFNTDRVTYIEHSIVSSGAPEYPTGLGLPNVTINIGDVPPPPPDPTCEAHNLDEGGVVRSSAPDSYSYAINCRVLYQNGSPTSWLGNALYSEANLGIPGLLDLVVQTAVDIYSPGGLTYFEGGAVFCLRGQGTLIWLATSGAPRVPQIIGSYTVPEFPGFTCATLFEPGMLIVVSRNPVGE